MKYRISISASLTLVLLSTIIGNINAEELKSLIPLRSELTGFEITEGPKYYDQDNLWDYINGGAQAYLAYSFEEMVTFTVMNSKDRLEIVADIYDMGDSLNAFGIYSVERSPDGHAVQFGSDGFRSDIMLYFWQGRYYVKLIAYEVTPETAKALSRLAQIITQKIPGKGGRPRLFSIFPEKGQLRGSERYIARDVLGQHYFANGYRMEYDQDDDVYQIIVIRAEKPEAAKQHFQRYLSFVGTVGQVTHERLEIGEQAFAGTDHYYGTILFARKGAYIIGILGLDSQQGAQEILTVVFSRLANMTGGEE